MIYIYWDNHDVPEGTRKVYIQCKDCYKENQKGISWPIEKGIKKLLCCNCKKVIYDKKSKKNKDTSK